MVYWSSVVPLSRSLSLGVLQHSSRSISSFLSLSWMRTLSYPMFLLSLRLFLIHSTLLSSSLPFYMYIDMFLLSSLEHCAIPLAIFSLATPRHHTLVHIHIRCTVSYMCTWKSFYAIYIATYISKSTSLSLLFK